MVRLIELYLEKTNNECNRYRKTGSSVTQNFSYSSYSPTSSPLSTSTFPSFTTSSFPSTPNNNNNNNNNNSTISSSLLFNGTNGEFYYDEDFSVPFDANLTETGRQVAPLRRVYSPGGVAPRREITWSGGGGGGGGEANYLFPYLTTDDVTGDNYDDVIGRGLRAGGGRRQPFGSLDSIQGNENDFASQSTSSPDLSSISASDVIVDFGKNKITNRYPIGDVSDDETIPKFEDDRGNSQGNAITTWAGLRIEKGNSNRTPGYRPKESSECSEISRISQRQRNWGLINDANKASNGNVIIESLLTWGQIKTRPKTSLEDQRTVTVEDEEDEEYDEEDENEEDEENEDEDDDEAVSRRQDSSDTSPVVIETSPVALETVLHKQSDDDDIRFPAAMTTWRTIRSSSRNGYHGDRPSNSSEVWDSLSLEGQRSSGGRSELTSSPSSKDDGYDSVTLKDLSELGQGHVSYQLLLEDDGEIEEEEDHEDEDGLNLTLKSSSDSSQVFAISNENPDFDVSRSGSDPDPELSSSNGPLDIISTSGLAVPLSNPSEPEVRVSDPEFKKPITSEDADNHDYDHHHRHLQRFYDSLVESAHSSSFRIFFDSTPDFATTRSFPAPGFADKSTQTLDQSSDIDNRKTGGHGKNGSGKPGDGSRWRKLYSINAPLPDLSFLAKRKQLYDGAKPSTSTLNQTSSTPAGLQNTQIDSSKLRNLDHTLSSRSSKPSKVPGPLSNQNGLHVESKPNEEISFSSLLFKSESRTICEELSPIVVDNSQPDNEENARDKNITERLIIEVCSSCKRRTVHIKNEQLRTNSTDRFIESLPPNALTSTQRTELNKTDEKFGPLLNPMRTTESPAPNCTRQNLLSKASLAVEMLLLHFNQDRRDKEQFGSTCSDSEIGVLVLRYLCPALFSILTDGLKPELRSYLGKVKNNVRNMIEDSVTLVGLPIFFQGIVSSLKRLKCLEAPLMFFNAFIFALLNCRVLDVWLSCVVRNALLLEKHYSAESVLRQTDDGSLLWVHEFLALLQPLSLLPFRVEYDLEARIIESTRKDQAQDPVPGPIQKYPSPREHVVLKFGGGGNFVESTEIKSF